MDSDRAGNRGASGGSHYIRYRSELTQKLSSAPSEGTGSTSDSTSPKRDFLPVSATFYSSPKLERPDEDVDNNGPPSPSSPRYISYRTNLAHRLASFQQPEQTKESPQNDKPLSTVVVVNASTSAPHGIQKLLRQSSDEGDKATTTSSEEFMYDTTMESLDKIVRRMSGTGDTPIDLPVAIPRRPKARRDQSGRLSPIRLAQNERLAYAREFSADEKDASTNDLSNQQQQQQQQQTISKPINNDNTRPLPVTIIATPTDPHKPSKNQILPQRLPPSSFERTKESPSPAVKRATETDVLSNAMARRGLVFELEDLEMGGSGQRGTGNLNTTTRGTKLDCYKDSNSLWCALFIFVLVAVPIGIGLGVALSANG